MAIINISVNQFLPITQSDQGPDGIIGQIVTQALILTQEVKCSSQFESANQPFNMQQTVAVGKILNLGVANVLSITQAMGRTYAIEGANALIISQQATNVNPQQIYQNLTIAQSVVPARALISTLTVGQIVKVQVIIGPVQTISSLTLTHGVSYFKKDAVKSFNIPVPLPTQFLTPGQNDSLNYLPVVLTFGTRVVTLKIPELGDSDKINVKRVQDQTRGGDTIIYRDPIWSITEILKYKFTNLTRNRSQELLRFFADTIGLSIQLTDHFGIIWNGIILNPDTEVICTNDNNCGSYDVEIEFQGEMQ